MKSDIFIETLGWPHNNYSLRQFVGSDKSDVVYQCTKSLCQKCLHEAVCCCLYTSNCGFRMMMYQVLLEASKL